MIFTIKPNNLKAKLIVVGKWIQAKQIQMAINYTSFDIFSSTSEEVTVIIGKSN